MARCVRFRLAADRLAVREARQRVRRFGGLPRQTVADAELVISELVANALLHARLAPGDPIDVELRRDGDRLTIAVDDHGGFSGPARGQAGTGLRVLGALCVEWSAAAGRVSAALAIPAGEG
jgi:anti-sigma regulatory factor (Ser/Thr protein kinase)